MAPDATEPGAEAIYGAGRTGALLQHQHHRGRLLITGAARQSLLHRITTNDINSLVPGTGAPALLVTGKGRILDRLTVLCREKDLLVLTAAGNGDRSRDAIRKYVVFEDVTVEDVTGATFLLALQGPHAAEVLAGAADAVGEARETLSDAAATPPSLEPYRHAPGRIGGADVTVFCEPGFAGAAWLITGPIGREDDVRKALAEAGRPLSLVEVARGEIAHGGAGGGQDHAGAALEALRVEAGLPAPGHELSEAYNPLEMRQEDAVSFDKGCYVGQEVIARLRTYDKVKRQMVRVEVEGSAPLPDDAVIRGPHGEGIVTSSAPVPGADRAVALAILPVEAGAAGEAEIPTPAGVRRARLLGPPPTARDVRMTPPRSPAPGKRRFGS